MIKTAFTDTEGRGEQHLRETHARLVGERIAPSPLGEGRQPIDAGTLATACAAVRDTYRCRTVRKELRRVILLCDEAGPGGKLMAGPWPAAGEIPAAA